MGKLSQDGEVVGERKMPHNSDVFPGVVFQSGVSFLAGCFAFQGQSVIFFFGVEWSV